MRYCFIDRVVKLEKKKFIVAKKSVAFTEDFVFRAFDSYPMMPNSVIIETLAQVGSLLIFEATDYSSNAFLMMVQKAEFKKPIYVGEEVFIKARLTSLDSVSARIEGRILVQKEERVAGFLILGLRSLLQNNERSDEQKKFKDWFDFLTFTHKLLSSIED